MILLRPPKTFAPNTEISIPGSKSITNRALILAALAKGKTTLLNAAICEDTHNMIYALRAFGIPIEINKTTIEIEGQDGVFTNPNRPVDLENTGTAVRFLTALASLIPGETIITGSTRMKSRPIHDLTEALQSLGVQITDTNDCPPTTITGKTFKGGTAHIPGDKSSQYLSAILLVAPYAEQDSVIHVMPPITSRPYIDMTVDLIKKFGGKIEIEEKGAELICKIPANQKYKPQTLDVEADASSAMYFCGIAALSGQKITITNLSSKTHQADIQCLDLFKKMGCKIQEEKNGFSIQGPEELKALDTIDMNTMPDAVMTIAVVAAFANGKTTITNIANLRIKECDRLEALEIELEKIGIKATATDDSIEIEGNIDPEKRYCAAIETYKDHRIAMAFALVAVKIPFLRIVDEKVVSKSYPSFFEDLEKIGFFIKKNFTKNIVLIGMRGTGKTLIGRKLAKKLGANFTDTDELVERRAKKSIKRIVGQKGWMEFRKREKYAIREISHFENCVISTGGGALLPPENEKKLHKNSIIVLLTADVEVMSNRIAGDKNRPSLTQSSPEKELEKVWNDRKERYMEMADIVYDTSYETSEKYKDLEKKADEIIELFMAKI